jgi:rod shape determining protein RodA
MARGAPVLGLAPVPGLAPVHPGRGRWPQRKRARDRRRQVLAWFAQLRRFDWILVAAVLGLSVYGILLVWSASHAALLQAAADPQTYLKKQLLNLVIGLVLMFLVGLLGPRVLRASAPLAYLVTLLGLLAVLSPLGASVNGARAWISLPGGFQAEPSELAKLTLILVTARILGQARTGDGRPGIRAVAPALACAAPAVVLVAAEPALGVTVLLTILVVSLIILAGTKLRWLAILAVTAALAVFTVWRLHLLKAYQLDRLAAFLHPGTDPAGTGYSATQSKIAIGSGGLFGQGLFHGQLITGNFVPEPHTDFIFAAAGEELGFVGAVAIIVLLGIVVGRSLLIAARAADQFGRLVAAGIAIWFAVQAFVNIGMTIGIVPVTGLPLPFVSYGGSALFADMLAVGALQAIRQRARVSEKGTVRAGWKHSVMWTLPRC